MLNKAECFGQRERKNPVLHAHSFKRSSAAFQWRFTKIEPKMSYFKHARKPPLLCVRCPHSCSPPPPPLLPRNLNKAADNGNVNASRMPFRPFYRFWGTRNPHASARRHPTKTFGGIDRPLLCVSYVRLLADNISQGHTRSAAVHTFKATNMTRRQQHWTHIVAVRWRWKCTAVPVIDFGKASEYIDLYWKRL